MKCIDLIICKVTMTKVILMPILCRWHCNLNNSLQYGLVLFPWCDVLSSEIVHSSIMVCIMDEMRSRQHNIERNVSLRWNKVLITNICAIMEWFVRNELLEISSISICIRIIYVDNVEVRQMHLLSTIIARFFINIFGLHHLKSKLC